jgi:hypothetical protein
VAGIEFRIIGLVLATLPTGVEAITASGYIERRDPAWVVAFPSIGVNEGLLEVLEAEEPLMLEVRDDKYIHYVAASTALLPGKCSKAREGITGGASGRWLTEIMGFPRWRIVGVPHSRT